MHDYHAFLWMAHPSGALAKASGDLQTFLVSRCREATKSEKNRFDTMSKRAA